MGHVVPNLALFLSLSRDLRNSESAMNYGQLPSNLRKRPYDMEGDPQLASSSFTPEPMFLRILANERSLASIMIRGKTFISDLMVCQLFVVNFFRIISM